MEEIQHIPGKSGETGLNEALIGVAMPLWNHP